MRIGHSAEIHSLGGAEERNPGSPVPMPVTGEIMRASQIAPLHSRQDSDFIDSIMAAQKWSDIFAAYEDGRASLERAGWTVEAFKEIQYGLQFEASNGEQRALLRLYGGKKGIRFDLSMVKNRKISGSLTEILGVAPPTAASASTKEGKGAAPATSDPPELIGVDESGKGDYFGPLVIAGVYVDAARSEALQAAGVRDSKTLSDKAIAAMAASIKSTCPHSIVLVGNERYNQLYSRIGNLNRLLAWGHARVIENLLAEVDCGVALSDQFANEGLIKNALLEKGQSIKLLQRTKAESNIAVAAASILARHAFVENINALGREFGLTFPKGASQATLKAARNFAQRFGRDQLVKVAKLHFKTSKQVP